MLYLTRRRVRNFAIAVLVLAGTAWIVPSYFNAERYRRGLQAGLEHTLHRPVKFGALSFRVLPRPGFSIEDAEVGEDPDFGSEPFARVDRIDCDLRWHSLWRSRMDFAHLHLDHPSFNMVLNSRGEWNVKKLLRESGLASSAAETAGANAAVAAEQLGLEVIDGRVNFQVGPNKKPFALTEVRASLQVNPSERRVQFQITASPVRSDLTIPSPGPVEADGSWTPGRDLRGPLDARLRTRGALLYDWIPVVTGKNPQVYGVIDSDLHLTGSLTDLAVAGETRLTQLHRWEELPPSDPMPWTIHFRGRLAEGRLEVEGLEAVFGDSHLHVSGSVDGMQSNPQLDLVMALERSRLEDALAVVRRLWPNSGSWDLKGRFDAMLSVQGPWNQRRYGGFLGAPDSSLETPSGGFPLSEIAVRIDSAGAVLAPVRITLAPRVTLLASGEIKRTHSGARYELQMAAKGMPLHDAVSFGRGLGIRFFHGIDATGSATASINLEGPARPLGRPMVTARAELRAARLLIPGLTEPLNIPRASLQINGDQIIADPVVAVLGTSVFNARLAHQGGRSNPWSADLHASSLRLEQGALWFDALGLRPPLPLFERLPGLATFSARREAASQIWDSLNAQVRFDTPILSYRDATLTDFHGAFEVAGRTVRMTTSKFRAAGGRGEAEGAWDFTTSPPLLSVQTSLTSVPLQPFAARLPGVIHDLRGVVNAVGDFRTRGLAREELAGNLTGHADLRLRDISFGDFDPLESLAKLAGWGKLDPLRGPVTAPLATLKMEIRNRALILQNAAIDLSGATLQFDGDYSLAGPLDVNLHADLRRLRRRWLSRDDDSSPPVGVEQFRLAGSLDHLMLNPQDGLASVGASRAAGVR